MLRSGLLVSQVATQMKFDYKLGQMESIMTKIAIMAKPKFFARRGLVVFVVTQIAATEVHIESSAQNQTTNRGLESIEGQQMQHAYFVTNIFVGQINTI